jgi:hypothetical protein
MEASRIGGFAGAKAGIEVSAGFGAQPKGYQVLPFTDIHSSKIHIKMLIWIWFSQGKGRIA